MGLDSDRANDNRQEFPTDTMRSDEIVSVDMDNEPVFYQGDGVVEVDGLATCTGIIIHHPNTKTALPLHMTSPCNIVELENHILAWKNRFGGSSKGAMVYIDGGAPIDGSEENLREADRNRRLVVDAFRRYGMEATFPIRASNQSVTMRINLRSGQYEAEVSDDQDYGDGWSGDFND